MRVVASSPGRAAAKYLQLKSMSEKILVVFSTFLFSGIIHMGIVPPAATSAGSLRLHVAGFFWMQPLGFAIEVLMHKLGTRVFKVLHVNLEAGLKKPVLRVINISWVLIWLYLTLPILQEPYKRLSWWRMQPPSVL